MTVMVAPNDCMTALIAPNDCTTALIVPNDCMTAIDLEGGVGAIAATAGVHWLAGACRIIIPREQCRFTGSTVRYYTWKAAWGHWSTACTGLLG
jgi:hypothetical protein